MEKQAAPKGVILKKGKEKALLQRHPWVFSGAVESHTPCQPGDLLSIYSYQHVFLAKAFINPENSLFGRIISFEDKDLSTILKEKIESACSLRDSLYNNTSTNAFRLINGEGDGIPGLVVDSYNGVLVVQIGHRGLENIKPLLSSLLVETVKPLCIVEKSESSSRKEEGLTSIVKVWFGTLPEECVIQENGLSFKVDILNGQKTGFFLDQREMRKKVGELAKGKRVLNAFSYTGGFSLYAAFNQAASVDSVDISSKALLLAEENMKLNHLKGTYQFFAEDVFTFLKEKPLNYDLVIIDPPAFAKKKKDVVSACRGYKELARQAFLKMPKGSTLLFSSCSHFIDENLLQTVLFQAGIEAKREVQIIGRHILAPDHPISLYHPEGGYLKSFLLFLQE